MEDARLFPRRNPRVAARTIDGEAVIVSPENAMLHTLNGTGTLIWELADGRADLDAIARRLAQVFEVTPEDARRDAAAFCRELVEKRLLELTDRPTGPGGGPR